MTLGEHPALWRHAYLRQHFTTRDRVNDVPERADPLEAKLMLRMKSTALGIRVHNLNSPSERLAAYRLEWFGWVSNPFGFALEKVRPEGEDALRAFLEDQEAAGDPVMAALRRKYYHRDDEPPVHPAEGDRRFRKLFTHRDLRTHPPEVPDNEEGAILLSFYRDFMGLYSIARHQMEPRNFRGAKAETKLAVMRMQMWGWLEGTGWALAGPVTDAGHEALQHWLVSKEAQGDMERAVARQSLFPTEQEVEALLAFDQRRRALRQEQLLVSRRITELDHNIGELQAVIHRCGMEIAQGDRHIDRLVTRMQKAWQEIETLQRAKAPLDADWVRIRQEIDLLS